MTTAWPANLDRDATSGLLAAGPAGWTTLGALLGAEPRRAAMIALFDLHTCWNIPGPCVREDRQHPACTGCRNQ